MKKPLILGVIAMLWSYNVLHAQVVVDSAGNVIGTVVPTSPVTTPAPVIATPVPAAAPANTTVVTPPATTTTVVTTPAAPTVTYDADASPAINVSKLRFGAFLAPTISWMRPTAATDDENQFNVSNGGSKIGFTYGLMGEYFFATNYGIVTGIQINQTGGNIIATNKNQSPTPSTSDQVLSADFNYRLQYLQVPIALKLRTDDISGFRFFGQLGASVGFNIGKKADYDVKYYQNAGGIGAIRDTSGTKIKLSGKVGNIAPVMFEMNIGAGAEYPINNKLTAYVGLFFNNGFAPDATKPNLFDEAKLGYAGEFRDANTRLNNFALRLGLFF